MKKKRFKENFTCFKLQSGVWKTYHADEFSHGFYFVNFLIFSRNIIRAKYHKNSHPRNLMCVKCQEKTFKKIKMDSKKLRMVLVLFYAFPSPKAKPYKHFHVFMFCNRQSISVKFCELFICEIKSAWKIVRKWEGRVDLVLKSRCM